MEKVLVSMCLLGTPVRYNGTSVPCTGNRLKQWLSEDRIIAFCPELAAGLAVPREPAEIQANAGLQVLNHAATVLTSGGSDLSSNFIAGAQQALATAQANHIRVAILTDGSPSCGSSYIYDGTFTGTRRIGNEGVTTALLRKHGIAVFHQGQMDEADALLRNFDRL